MLLTVEGSDLPSVGHLNLYLLHPVLVFISPGLCRPYCIYDLPLLVSYNSVALIIKTVLSCAPTLILSESLLLLSLVFNLES